MRSYTTILSLLRTACKIGSTDTVSDAILMGFYNDSVRTMAGMRGGKLPFLKITRTVNTVASARTIKIPNAIEKISSFYVTVGTQVYSPDPIFNSDDYIKMLQAQLGESDELTAYFRDNNTASLIPVPATSSNVITIIGTRKIRDISIADYTTGTIVTTTNGGTTVVGSGTSWTASMAGRFIRITNSDTANKGDGVWYEIESVTNSTTLVLVAPYEGTAITAGAAAYIIGEVSVIPEAYEMGPVYRALAIWNQIYDPIHPNVAAGWWKLYDGGQEAGLIKSAPGGIVGQMLENEGELVDTPYISPNGNGRIIDPNNPQQDATAGSFT